MYVRVHKIRFINLEAANLYYKYDHSFTACRKLWSWNILRK